MESRIFRCTDASMPFAQSACSIFRRPHWLYLILSFTKALVNRSSSMNFPLTSRSIIRACASSSSPQSLIFCNISPDECSLRAQSAISLLNTCFSVISVFFISFFPFFQVNFLDFFARIIRFFPNWSHFSSISSKFRSESIVFKSLIYNGFTSK